MLKKYKKHVYLIVVLVLLIVLSTFGKSFLFKISFQNTETQLNMLMNLKKIRIQHELIVGLKIAKILSYSIEGQHERMYKFNALYRNSIINQFTQILRKYNNVFGIWGEFEPDIFDRVNPKNFIGFLGSSHEGIFIPYVYREDNELYIECPDMIMYNENYTDLAHYYLVLDYKKEVITPPYTYGFVNRKTNVFYKKNMITISHPIFYKEDFMGMVGVDILLKLFEDIINLDEHLLESLYANFILFSNDGHIITSTNPDYIKKHITDIFIHDEQYLNKILHIINTDINRVYVDKFFDNYEKTHMTFSTISVGDIPQELQWTLLLYMPEKYTTYDAQVVVRGFVFLITILFVLILLRKN